MRLFSGFAWNCAWRWSLERTASLWNYFTCNIHTAFRKISRLVLLYRHADTSNTVKSNFKMWNGKVHSYQLVLISRHCDEHTIVKREEESLFLVGWMGSCSDWLRRKNMVEWILVAVVTERVEAGSWQLTSGCSFCSRWTPNEANARSIFTHRT